MQLEGKRSNKLFAKWKLVKFAVPTKLLSKESSSYWYCVSALPCGFWIAVLFLFTSSIQEMTSFYIKSGWMGALHIWESGRFFFVSMSMDPLNRRWHQFQYFMKKIMLFVMFLHRFIHFNLFVYLFTNQAKLKSVTQIWVLLQNNIYEP